MARKPSTPGDTLAEYPRPSVAVDVAVLTVKEDLLQVVVVEHRLGGLALPGTFLHAGERLTDAADRALRDKANLTHVTFSQLRVFDDPERDDRGWVLSVGHSGGLADERIPADVRLMLILDGKASGPLLFDHAEIVALAVDDLRLRYARALDPDGLLGPTFTVLELRRIYQAVFGHPLVKDTFRRYVIDAVEATGEMAAAFGRPAELFRRKAGTSLPASAWAFFVTGGR